jgi:hypothetical protein
VVNVDQTVILIWDAGQGLQHFIRRASFKGEAEDFGFLVPSPTRPELNESGDEAFPYLQKLTEPETKRLPRPSGVSCGCSKSAMKGAAPPPVTVLEEKRVAGFHASILESRSADALVGWLKDHGYAYSSELAAWADPYVKAGWKFTALQVARDPQGKSQKTVAAAALRISFKTDRPIFPYREPNPRSAAEALGAKNRLLRIYFVGQGKYRGEFARQERWTGTVAWANPLKADEDRKLMDLLKLPPLAGGADWWLTEFEDDWPYREAPSDVFFARGADQTPVRRPPIIEYVSSGWPMDVSGYALAAVVILPPVWRRLRRG